MKPKPGRVPAVSSSVGISARSPWELDADDFPAEGAPQEMLWFALQYAVLAPSTHNTQPWAFHIQGDQVELYGDWSRALPVIDPAGRELTISCGAALLQLRVALDYFGHSSAVDILPDIDRPDLLARVRLGLKSETDSETILLFHAILNRRTNRRAFRDEPIPDAVMQELQAAAASEGAWLHFAPDEANRRSLADLVAEADRLQWADKQFRQELAEWVRPNSSPRHDGLSVESQHLGNLMSHVAPFSIRTFDLGKGQAAQDREIALFSPVLAVLGTDTEEPASWLAAGQALGRVLLQAQSEDVAVSYLNQPVEVPDLRFRVAESIPRGGFPQLVLRMGYGLSCPPAPRRTVNEVLLPDAHRTEV